jgi:phosphoribosylformylglycinamidine cyclo-ligase
VLSPTRTYAPIIKELLNERYGCPTINGIIHCSGGGQTKVMKFVDNVHVIKDNLFLNVPLFEMIRECGGYHAERRKEMYSSFNMGHRMEVYVPSQELADLVIEIAKNFNVEAKVIGHVEASETKKLTIKDNWSEFVW